MKLVVGLGNPGKEYDKTRHNVGFDVLDELVRRTGVTLRRGWTVPAWTGKAELEGKNVLLVKPRTFMNDSGAAVAKACAYFGVKPAEVVVVHDELDLDFGRLRLKLGGGDNGHNGLKSIRSALGTGDFHRVRFGIGRPPGRQAPSDFVLTNFPASAREELALEIDRSADAVEALILRGLEAAQNTFNS